MKILKLTITIFLFNWSGIYAQEDFAQGLFAYSTAREYHTGSKGEKNIDKAIEYYEKAASFGDIKSEYWLGIIYLNEKDDLLKGIKWIEKSANNNHPGGQLNLGKAYISGKGKEKNFLEGLMWLMLAKDSSNNDERVIKEIDKYSSIMPMSVFDDAKIKANLWKDEFDKKQVSKSKLTPEITVSKNGNVTNYNVKGSLEGIEQLGCIDISNVSNQNLPPDLLVLKNVSILENMLKVLRCILQHAYLEHLMLKELKTEPQGKG